MNALAYVLEQAEYLFSPVEPGFAEMPKPSVTPTYLREATPCPWFACSCHGEQS